MIPPQDETGMLLSVVGFFFVVFVFFSDGKQKLTNLPKVTWLVQGRV